MPDTPAPRRLQARLSPGAEAEAARPPGASWLAVECAGRGLLLPLVDAGEIFPVVAMVPVAHVRPWFLGIANLRGELHGVVDLGAFLGLGMPERRHEEARLVAFSAALDINCALLVDRLAGLRSAGQLVAATPAAAQPARPFVGDEYADEAGRHWQELRLSALARDDAFLSIAA